MEKDLEQLQIEPGPSKKQPDSAGPSKAMVKKTFQPELLTILDSYIDKPLVGWGEKVRNGYIELATDDHIKSPVLELVATNLFATYIRTPVDLKASLGIQLPIVVVIIKKLKHDVTVEVQVKDDTDTVRRFQASTHHESTCVKPKICNLSLDLDHLWNRVEFDLTDMTLAAYGTKYIETVKVKIHPNCRIRRVYFSDLQYTEDELPDDYKLYKLPKKKTRKRK